MEIDQLHLSRLALVPIERLDDDRLLATLSPGSRNGASGAVKNQAARLIDGRPSLMTTGRIEIIDLYGDLAVEAAHDGDRTGAEEWIVRGRQAESPKKRSANALAWEMIGLEVKMLLDEPEVWVPVLAVILERCRGNNEATSAVLLRLVSLGLVQAGVDPKRPDQLILDTQMLEQYLKRYGPRVTTATGELGVAASQSEIWTPESTEAPSAIWTPGSPTGQARENRSSSCREQSTPIRRSDQSLRSNRYSHFIVAICRPDTARRRKMSVGGEPLKHEVLDGSRRDSGGLLRLTRK